MTLREQLLTTLQAQLIRYLPATPAIAVYRSPSIALTREAHPAVILLPESERVVEYANDRVTRELMLKVMVVVRALSDAQALSQVDQWLLQVHIAVMQDVNLGGLALGIKEIDTEWELEDADATQAMVCVRYQVTYRTLLADLGGMA